MWVKWVSTVRALSTSFSAIRWLVLPARTSSATSCSGGESACADWLPLDQHQADGFRRFGGDQVVQDHAEQRCHRTFGLVAGRKGA
jgi:hypothetical protein